MPQQPTNRRRFLVLAGTTAATALAGCVTSGGATQNGTTTPTADHAEEDDHAEDGGSHGHDEIPQAPVDHAEVRMYTDSTGFHFSPHVVWVAEGGTVTFHNESGVHTATAYHPANDSPRRIPADADPFASGTVTEAGATYEHTFETPGIYDYFCAPHEAVGMVASVIVGTPDPHDQPGLAPPQASLPDGAAAKIESLNEMCEQALGHTH